MINSVYEPIIFTGNDSATTFAFNWKVAEEDFLVATLVDIATKAETVLVLDTDYSITGVGEDAGGSISYPLTGDPMPATKKLVLSLDIPPLQEISFDDQGGFFPLTHERAFDKVTQILQGFKEILARCVKVTIVSEADPDDLIAQLNADVAAAAAAATAAGAAQTAAEAAQTAAEAAQTAAETAQSAAETAQAAAETAQGLAVTAQGGAETAQGFAETAQTAAEAAQTAAEAAQTAAETAQGLAETAQAAAEAAATTATTQAGLAATAKTGAESAQTAAEAAQTAAEAAQTAAEAAQAAAEAAAATFTKASQAEAEAGTDDTKYMTPLKTDEAIQARKVRSGTGTIASNELAIDASALDIVNVTANANFTLNIPTNGQAGQRISVRVTQDGTGSRKLTLHSSFLLASELAVDGVVLSTAAGAIDKIGLYCVDGTVWEVEAFGTDYAVA